MPNNDETFYFLKEDFPKIEKICMTVEENIYTNPVYAVMEGRKATEKILDEVIDKESLQMLKNSNLNEKINEINSLSIFSKAGYVFRAFDYNRKLGNIAAHHEVHSEITTALRVHENLFTIAKWFHDKYLDKYEIGEYKNPIPENLKSKNKFLEEDISILDNDQNYEDSQNNKHDYKNLSSESDTNTNKINENRTKIRKDSFPEKTSYTQRNTKKIKSFNFNGNEYVVRNSKDLLLQLLSILYNSENDFDKVFQLKGRNKPYFSKDPEVLRSAKLIKGTNIYAETNRSTENIINFSKKLLNQFNYAPETLKITFYDDVSIDEDNLFLKNRGYGKEFSSKPSLKLDSHKSTESKIDNSKNIPKKKEENENLDYYKITMKNLKGWNKAVFDKITLLNSEFFTYQNLLVFIPDFQEMFPNNSAIESTIRFTLQRLRDLGLIDFLSRGNYKNKVFCYLQSSINERKYENPILEVADSENKFLEEDVSIMEDNNINKEKSLNNGFSENGYENSSEEIFEPEISYFNKSKDFLISKGDIINVNDTEDKYNLNEATELNSKLNNHFLGKVVRKDLTKKIKEGANVPVYVLEYLLGKYATGVDEHQIQKGLEKVKNILSDNFVRPDEAQKVISKIREIGSFTVIDNVSVKLNYHTDNYEAEFSNLGLKGVPIAKKFPKQYERLLGGNIWCMINFEYYFDEADPKRNPFIINNLSPIQMPNLDLEEILNARENFSKGEWIDILLRSCGMEPSQLTERVKWLLITRLVPLVENNFNLCELGPRSTGKSHIYKEISPNSILVSGGQTTVANLFYNMSTKLVGLVGMWDCVAFDEVAGIKFSDADGVAIMKDYMASGSFSRGKEKKNALASMVFVGNINQSVDYLLKTSNLFTPFPGEIAKDSAFFDRIHCYIPGWEIPKFNPEHFTNDYGFITDYFAEFMREMRKRSFSGSYLEYFKLGRDLNQRDTIAVKKMVSGLIKLIYPNGKYDKEDIRELLILSLESRRRVKEQLKRIAGLEFFDVNFSFIDNETDKEERVGVKEQSKGELIFEGSTGPNHYNISTDKTSTEVIENSEHNLESEPISSTFSKNLESLKIYESQIHELKNLYENKEKIARDLIEKCFSPPQMSYDRFIDELDSYNILFYNQAESALKIIEANVGYTPKVDDELKKRLNTLKSFVEKIDELNIELAIKLSNSSEESYSGEIEDLLEDMQKLVDSVKEYD
ncbi:MAG: protease Lon-related BREX system protein BrxL [Methanobrevibacter sp.]|nr:protease Lon-related BREX system protein BrxL [Methanobrevibacter sp.]